MMFDELLEIVMDRLIVSGLDEAEATELVVEFLGSVIPIDMLMRMLQGSTMYS